MLDNIEGFILDLDGTVYRGDLAIDGARETIAALKANGKRVVYLSNRGNISRATCYKKLTDMGMDVSIDEIILTSTVTAQYLKSAHPEDSAWVLGDKGLREELSSVGVALAEKPEESDWLVITLHENLTYIELNHAFRAVRHGARIIATNADKSFPRDDGECIDVAGMIGAIVATTGKEAELVMGKPSAYMANAALQQLGLAAEQCLIIGDSMASDIQLGKQAGMRTALVLSGSSSLDDVAQASDQPDWIWESLYELKANLE